MNLRITLLAFLCLCATAILRAERVDMLKAGAKVRVFDPIAMVECKRRIGDVVTYTDNIYDCVDGAYAMLLMTEWRQFRLPSWSVIKKVMIGNIIVDGRNIYHREELEAEGFVYTTIGE